VQTATTVYEQPLNERLRFFLRLEFLFRHARHHLRGEAVWDSHSTLLSLLEILNIVSRVDMKTEVIKELDRINATLGALCQNPDINHDTLDQLLTTLTGFKTQLYSLDGPLAQELRENEFIKSLLQRSGIPGGMCDFDLPAYRHWLKQPADARIQELKQWLGTLDTLRLSVELMLKLVRESAEPRAQRADNGLYQQALDPATPYQMIRVWLPADSPYFAEVSGGKHRFTLRFMEAVARPRPIQTANSVDFQLSCCAL
jgi:cell division protein ZapD